MFGNNNMRGNNVQPKQARDPFGNFGMMGFNDNDDFFGGGMGGGMMGGGMGGMSSF
jgi:hypothetical protein